LTSLGGDLKLIKRLNKKINKDMGFESMSFNQPESSEEEISAPEEKLDTEKKEEAEVEWKHSVEDVSEGIAAQIKKFREGKNGEVSILHDLVIEAMKRKIPFSINEARSVFGDASRLEKGREGVESGGIMQRETGGMEALNDKMQRLLSIYEETGRYEEYKLDMAGNEIKY
jgi:monoamine oxidase